MNPRFHGSRLKIERAKLHILDLQMRANAFAQENPHTIHIEHNLHANCDVIKIEPAKPLPDGFMLILGDALHNLRTALDHAMHEVVFKWTSHTKFPVHDTPDGLKVAVNGGLKENTSKEILDFIVDVVQPYKGGNGNAIWALHGLDIEDKHRLLLAYREFTKVENIRAVDGTGESFTIDDWLVVPPYTAQHLCVGHRNIKITNNGQAMLRVTFGKGLPLEGQFVVPALRQITDIVTGTIDGLEKILLAALRQKVINTK